jgi:hypothetical protein
MTHFFAGYTIGFVIIALGFAIAILRLILGVPKEPIQAISVHLNYISMILVMILFTIIGGLIILMAKLDTITQLFL